MNLETLVEIQHRLCAEFGTLVLKNRARCPECRVITCASQALLFLTLSVWINHCSFSAKITFVAFYGLLFSS